MASRAVSLSSFAAPNSYSSLSSSCSSWRRARILCMRPLRGLMRGHIHQPISHSRGLPKLPQFGNRNIIVSNEGIHQRMTVAAFNPVDGEVISGFYLKWDSITENISASATFAFLLLQLPQIILNYQNLMAGNKTALFAIPWTGLLTSLLGNLSLLSYFSGKKEKGATIVQAVGVLSTFGVLVQVASAGAMPTPVFIATTVAIIAGFIFNSLNYNNLLSPCLWRLWQDIISIGGVSVLPQVMWTTFEPYVPPSLLPGTIFLAFSTLLVLMGHLEKLPKNMTDFMGGLAAWSAMLLFMWGPVSQMWTNFINPSNIQGLSVLTILLAMLGNGLLLPRALFTRDLMWFTGSLWGTLVQGWGILLSMYLNKCLSRIVFLGITSALVIWLASMLVMDSSAYSLDSPFSPLAELISAKRRI